MEESISIIIPALNEEKRIPALLSEIQGRQGGLASEVIVVDGGSTDSTVELAEKGGAKVLQPGVRGRAAQMNAGAKAASSDILFFLHADTTPPFNFDSIIIHSKKRGADAGCFRLKFDRDHPLLNFFGWCTRFRSTLIRFGDQGLFVKKQMFEKAGGFDETLTLMEDQEMVRELKKRGEFELLEENVTTSARKYEKIGVLRLQALFFSIWAGHYLGMSQEALVHFYRSVLSGNKK
ncbi:MAG: TIGR04283 family arsenosugar biosynthesis glycosyltransferase [Balneolaceae bacterium]|nr:TIGR04283 family arsenosugar biosynthesis glycosyltransferase [Balneolaceae bacterium]MCH8549108.1 TIGR04283 family arsenosugar biosynthesis glycosyltransferase [Balneolaceae bacterium]